MKIEILTNNVKETIKLGEIIGKHLFPGSVVTLEGDLGAGKTTFTKGIALSMKIEDTINSPTFTIMRNYEGDNNLNHIDAYRLEGIGYDYDLEEYIYSDDITVIEWALNIKDSIPNEALNINIFRIDDNSRKFEIVSTNSKYIELFEVLKNELFDN